MKAQIWNEEVKRLTVRYVIIGWAVMGFLVAVLILGSFDWARIIREL